MFFSGNLQTSLCVVFRNCLFRALGDQIEGDHTLHARHRREAVKYMRDHRSDFEPFMEDNVSFDKHCKCEYSSLNHFQDIFAVNRDLLILVQESTSFSNSKRVDMRELMPRQLNCINYNDCTCCSQRVKERFLGYSPSSRKWTPQEPEKKCPQLELAAYGNL